MATVLVVDDDPTNREFLRTLLLHRGHSVREASDGDSALRLARLEPPDAVITDVLMPGLDGYELARQLRTGPPTDGVPIAFSTAHYREHEIRPLARACGVHDVILKPAHPRQVLAAIDALLAGPPSGRSPAAAVRDFSAEHRQALKTKLLEKATALAAADLREARLRERAARLAAQLAETQRLTRSSTWDLDPAGGMLLRSPALRELFGVASGAVTQEQFWRRVHPDDTARARALAAEATRTGLPQVTELRIADPAGVTRRLVVSCRAGSGDGVLWGVTQDVTDEREEQARLRVAADLRARHRTRERFQRAMFPREVPPVPGVDVAAAYLAADGRLDAGGDWYDVLPAADGSVLLVLGAVAAQGQDATAVMGPVRAVLRAYAMEDPDPSRVLDRLNRFLVADRTDDAYVTAVLARYDPARRRLGVATAGHPPPLLVLDDGAGPAAGPQVVPLTVSAPALGVLPDAVFAERRLTLGPGGTLCLYSDGLTDLFVSGRSGGRRLDRVLADAVAAAGPGKDGGHKDGERKVDAQTVVDAVVAELVPDAGRDDDVCLAVLRAR